MIEIGKKYRLKKYVFDKNFLIDPDKPDEIYADIKITKG